MTDVAARPVVRQAGTARRMLALGVSAAVLVVVVLLSLALGARAIAPDHVLAALTGHGTGTDASVVLDLRLPRTLIGLVAGAAFAAAGVVMQTLTRNPLADPGLLGVNAGASLAVVLSIAVLAVHTALGYTVAALIGAAVATVIVYLVGARGRGASPVSLTLAGAAVTAGLTSIITLVLLRDLDTLQQYRFWSVGSLVGRDLGALVIVGPVVLGGALVALGAGRSLDILALGEDVARGLGLRVPVVRALAIGAIVLLAGGATSIAGPIVFIGLVVPHLAGRFAGAHVRWTLVLAMVMGPSLLLVADILGRLVVPPGELEAGLVVAVVGAPVMIVLARRLRGSAS